MYASRMKSGGTGLKTLALVSALALGGGYVWVSQQSAAKKRADARDVQERAVLPGSKSPWMPAEGEGFKKVRVPDSSNWTDANGVQPKKDDEASRTILPGSKIGWIKPPEGDGKEPETRTVLPGSKSIDWVLPPIPPDKEEP